MKNLIKGSLLLMFTMVGVFLFSQENCQVLKPEIAGSYSGKCKNGLAHGKGKAVGKDTYEGTFSKGLPDGKGAYTWSTGEVYNGEWKEGFQEGEGKYSFKKNGNDTTISGIWVKDVYTGPKPIQPRIKSSLGVDRYNFQRMGDIKNRVLVNFYQNGSRNIGIQNLLMTTTSGYETSVGQSIGYEGIIFPVVIKLNYTTWNKLHTSQNYIIFEFEITEPGDWKVEVYN